MDPNISEVIRIAILSFNEDAWGFDARDSRIINLSDPENDKDAINLSTLNKYLQNNVNEKIKDSPEIQEVLKTLQLLKQNKIEYEITFKTLGDKISSLSKTMELFNINSNKADTNFDNTISSFKEQFRSIKEDIVILKKIKCNFDAVKIDFDNMKTQTTNIPTLNMKIDDIRTTLNASSSSIMALDSQLLDLDMKYRELVNCPTNISLLETNMRQNKENIEIIRNSISATFSNITKLINEKLLIRTNVSEPSSDLCGCNNTLKDATNQLQTEFTEFKNNTELSLNKIGTLEKNHTDFSKTITEELEKNTKLIHDAERINKNAIKKCDTETLKISDGLKMQTGIVKKVMDMQTDLSQKLDKVPEKIETAINKYEEENEKIIKELKNKDGEIEKNLRTLSDTVTNLDEARGRTITELNENLTTLTTNFTNFTNDSNISTINSVIQKVNENVKNVIKDNKTNEEKTGQLEIQLKSFEKKIALLLPKSEFTEFKKEYDVFKTGLIVKENIEGGEDDDEDDEEIERPFTFRDYVEHKIITVKIPIKKEAIYGNFKLSLMNDVFKIGKPHTDIRMLSTDPIPKFITSLLRIEITDIITFFEIVDQNNKKYGPEKLKANLPKPITISVNGETSNPTKKRSVTFRTMLPMSAAKNGMQNLLINDFDDLKVVVLDDEKLSECILHSDPSKEHECIKSAKTIDLFVQIQIVIYRN